MKATQKQFRPTPQLKNIQSVLLVGSKKTLHEQNLLRILFIKGGFNVVEAHSYDQAMNIIANGKMNAAIFFPEGNVHKIIYEKNPKLPQSTIVLYRYKDKIHMKEGIQYLDYSILPTDIVKAVRMTLESG